VAAGVLIDTGPLVALIDRGEDRHADCVAALREVQPPLITTWPVVTEAMRLLRRGGWPAQRMLWELLATDDFELATLDADEVARARALMEKYRELPMALADATLVAMGERRRLRTVLTLDGHFVVYRTATRTGFEVLPAPLS
jgi:predicted nucleic acid-binding protein